MRRVRHTVNGGPEVLFVEDAPVPEPGPGELLVRVEAIGVSLPGVRRVRGGTGPQPLGGELAGVVEALGPEAAGAGFAVGDRITGLCFGHGYAERALVHTATASRVPDGASAVDAVALVRSGLVARGALDAAGLRPGESVLVTAAASGVGQLAVPLAKLLGAGRVVAAAGSPDKAAFLRGLGADEVVRYGEESWGEPVDVVLDAVGGELLPRAVAALAPGGRLVAYSSGGGTVEAYELLAGAKSVIGFQMAHLVRTRPEDYAAWRDELWALHAAGRLRPAVHARVPLARAAEAHAIIERRENLGKVVLIP
ncbi:zinc-binding alcohol dehydrogenase family protein [Streptomyces sp. NPDC053493]|uniref:zinc-binding alcohol dehydrogenase family protein n=1 Tax=Streptomyces sp. NPDC053493 TaxID=3365705 RepID=UPI0037CF864A